MIKYGEEPRLPSGTTYGLRARYARKAQSLDPSDIFGADHGPSK